MQSAYFKREEFACTDGCGFDDVSQELVDKLDDLREDLRDPMIILSGCRCKKRNEMVGGAKNSAHLRGLAADIKPKDPALLDDLKKLAEDYFVRRGYAKTYLHVDVDKSLPQKTWVY